MRVLIAKALVLALMLAICNPVRAASTLRCGTELMSVGDSTAEVLLKCGDPFTREQIGIRYTGTLDMIVELWTYHIGRGQFLKLLTFEAGRLVAIDNGDRM